MEAYVFEDFDSDSEPEVLWGELPDDVWLQIFRFLPQYTILSVICNVCSRFRATAFYSTLWRVLDFRKWDDHPALVMSFLELLKPEMGKVSNHLRSLSFGKNTGNNVFGSNSRWLFYACHNLVYLDVGECDQMTALTVDELAYYFCNVKTLILQGCRKVDDEAMRAVSKFPNLSSLNITNCTNVTDVGLNFVAGMRSRLLHLETSEVWHLSDEAIQNLVSQQPQIESLILYGENLTDLSVISTCHYLGNLRTFQMSFCRGLTDRSIFALCGKVRLQTLHLKKIAEEITTEALTLLFKETPLVNLRDLAICNTDAIVDDTVYAIAAGCPNLQKLHLDWCCEVTDNSMGELFRSCRHLQFVSLTGLGGLEGNWLVDIDHQLPFLTHLDVSLCRSIPGHRLRHLLLRNRKLEVYIHGGHLAQEPRRRRVALRDYL
ncbi:unnamed protein product [Clavelina lepadiformis]|uniref:F-box domain-containing protein n=1 Tax=Clavelina lepadiformis TaxID=159417 RepID=A0ABP0F2U9_CLALP